MLAEATATAYGSFSMRSNRFSGIVSLAVLDSSAAAAAAFLFFLLARFLAPADVFLLGSTAWIIAFSCLILPAPAHA